MTSDVRPPFDAELAPALPMLAAAVPPSLTSDDIARVRGFLDAVPVAESLPVAGAFDFEDRRVPGPSNAPDVPVLVCRPKGMQGAVPCIYWIHGGGMISGTYRQGMEDILNWAKSLQVAVVSVEYRLAPEHPHPAPVEDCFAGLAWLAAEADALGVDPGRIVIAGASAGGGLAAAVALMARDRGGPRLFGQLLLFPMLDDRNITASSRQIDGVGVWDRHSNEMGWTALLGDRCAGPDVPAYAAPARASDLSSLPPTFIDVGSAEVFRDEAVDYASRIWAAGGSAELHVWSGGFHGFSNLAPDAAISVAAREAPLNWLRRQLRVPDA